MARQTRADETVLLPSSGSPFETPKGNGEFILLADDSQTVREVITAILGKNGYRVQGCADGAEALEYFSAHRTEVSLVISDADMPNLAGADLSRALLQLRPDIPLLAISGSSLADDGAGKMPAISTFAHAFMRKPFKPKDLLRTVHGLLHPEAKSGAGTSS